MEAAKPIGIQTQNPKEEINFKMIDIKNFQFNLNNKIFNFFLY